jgi:hypothetical protein
VNLCPPAVSGAPLVKNRIVSAAYDCLPQSRPLRAAPGSVPCTERFRNQVAWTEGAFVSSCPWTGLGGQSSAKNIGILAEAGLAILTSGQWWRLLGGLRPSEALVFVCRVGTRDEPEKNQDRCGNNATAGACNDQIAHSGIRPGASKPLAVASHGNTRRLNPRFSRNERCAPQNAREGMR